MPIVGKIEDLLPPTRTLRVPEKANEHVDAMQERLNEVMLQDPIAVTGYFGPSTRGKLRRWQATRGALTADGQCDAATWNALRTG